LGGDPMTADPLRRFEEEHEVALAALERLEQAATALQESGPPESHFAATREVLALLRGAVREHNENEERALFPLLGEDAPLGPFLEEHEILWRLEVDLAAALERQDRTRVTRLAFEIIDLLRIHIRRENEILFPMARALLGAEGLASVARRLNL
jgi:hemerythrin-like domain-containing protein